MANDISAVAGNAFSQMLQSQTGSALKGASRLNATSDEAKIQSSAKQFEGILLTSWLQQAEKSFATVPGGDPEDEASDPGKSQFQQYAMQSVATALVNSGGIGIAPMIAASLRKQNAAGAEKNLGVGGQVDEK